jgi:hypothetical protein
MVNVCTVFRKDGIQLVWFQATAADEGPCVISVPSLGASGPAVRSACRIVLAPVTVAAWFDLGNMLLVWQRRAASRRHQHKGELSQSQALALHGRGTSCA